MDSIKLTPRLQCVADMIPRCQLLADIGTDHAYIPMYALQNNIAKSARACDVADGPVKIAKNNVEENGLSDKTEVIKANGLDAAKGADVAVIAGMGGKLICEILENNIELAHSIKTVILQPMTCEYELRVFLHSKGFKIDREALAKEDNKVYNIMAVSKGDESYDDELYYYIGKCLFDDKNPLLCDYIRNKARVLKNRVNGMSLSENSEILTECKNIERLYKRLIDEEARLCQG